MLERTYLGFLVTFHLIFTWFSQWSGLLDFFFKRWVSTTNCFSSIFTEILADTHWRGCHWYSHLVSLEKLGQTRGLSRVLPEFMSIFWLFPEAGCLANMALCRYTVQGFAQPNPGTSSLEPRAFSNLTSKTTIKSFNTYINLWKVKPLYKWTRRSILGSVCPTK